MFVYSFIHWIIYLLSYCTIFIYLSVCGLLILLFIHLSCWDYLFTHLCVKFLTLFNYIFIIYDLFLHLVSYLLHQSLVYLFPYKPCLGCRICLSICVYGICLFALICINCIIYLFGICLFSNLFICTGFVYCCICGIFFF